MASSCNVIGPSAVRDSRSRNEETPAERPGSLVDGNLPYALLIGLTVLPRSDPKQRSCSAFPVVRCRATEAQAASGNRASNPKPPSLRHPHAPAAAGTITNHCDKSQSARSDSGEVWLRRIAGNRVAGNEKAPTKSRGCQYSTALPRYASETDDAFYRKAHSPRVRWCTDKSENSRVLLPHVPAGETVDRRARVHTL
jgi:hypothetical protein